MSNTHPSLQPFSFDKENLEKLKATYGKIFKVSAAGIDFVIRPLYPEDWNQVTSMASANDKITVSDIDDKIVSLGLVGPLPDFTKGGWASIPAGVIPSLSMFIRAKSGFFVPDAPDALQVSMEPIGPVEAPKKPTKEEVEELKAKCPLAMKLINIEGDYFVIRQITRTEWKAAVAKGQEEGDDERALEVTKRVVMWPKNVNWDAKGAGYCEAISNFTLGISGYDISPDVEEL